MNHKKIAAKIGIIFLLTVSLAGQCFAAGIPFTDLGNIPQRDQILDLQEKGYLNGVGNGLFAPGSEITAAQSIQLFVNAFGLNIDNIRFFKKPEVTDYFKNAKDNAWYADALITASFHIPELPIDLNPDQKWSREEFTYYLVKTMEKKYELPMVKLLPVQISDADQMAADYSGAIQRALTYGIVKLDKDGKFKPKEKITRAEAAEQVYNALEYGRAHPAV